MPFQSLKNQCENFGKMFGKYLHSSAPGVLFCPSPGSLTLANGAHSVPAASLAGICGYTRGIGRTPKRHVTTSRFSDWKVLFLFLLLVLYLLVPFSRAIRFCFLASFESHPPILVLVLVLVLLLLLTTYYLLLTTYYLLLTTSYFLLPTYYLLLTTYYLLLTTYYLLLATCYLLLATCYLLLATCYLLLATCYLLLATCYLLLTTYYLLAKPVFGLRLVGGGSGGGNGGGGVAHGKVLKFQK